MEGSTQWRVKANRGLIQPMVKDPNYSNGGIESLSSLQLKTYA